jgi:hypothetical protein
MDTAHTTPSVREPRRQRAPTPERSNPDDEEHRDENLDRTLEESFPASDPPSSIPDPADGSDQPGGPDDEDDRP